MTAADDENPQLPPGSLAALPSALSRLRIRHLQALDILQRVGSLRQVAIELGITQPSALSLIDDLEFAFGAPLVVRDHSGTRLTPAARAVLARTRVALQEVAMGRQIALQHGGATARLRIGASPYLIGVAVPAMLARVREQLPDVRIDIQEGALDVLVTRLAQGELDAVLGNVERATLSANGFSLDQTMLGSEPLYVVAGPGHPLHGKSKASLRETLAGPWALPHAASHIRNLFDSAVFDAGAPPVVPQVECRGLLNLLSIAQATGMLTIAPATEIAKPMWSHDLTRLDCGISLRVPPYILLSRHYAPAIPEVEVLKACARSVAADLFVLADT